ncbi:hypothetical protein BDF19DRAFT_432672 [Syncephalis fuscata]|nr:hypothetical protein BDF19DRAFT_432672 [Syncephalis fuscata]
MPCPPDTHSVSIILAPIICFYTISNFSGILYGSQVCCLRIAEARTLLFLILSIGKHMLLMPFSLLKIELR